MFNLLVSTSLRNRLFVLIAAAILTAYGGIALTKLPIDVFPELNKPTVTVMTEVEGLAPEEVEQIVTFPIEAAMNGLPGVTRVRSVSSAGLSIIFVEFDWGTDIYRNRQQVAERLSLIGEQLPDDVTAQMGPISSIMGEIMLIALSGDGVSPMKLRELADWVIRPRLLNISGIAQVIPIGGQIRQFRITPKLGLMKSLDITIEQIEHTIRAFSDNTGGGFVDQREREYLIRNIARTRRLADLRDLVVAHRDGQSILLQQVADVEYAARIKRGDAGFMGKPTVILSVQKQPGADTVRLTGEVEAALEDLARYMPPGVSAGNILFKQADFIENSINNLNKVLVEAAVVVAVILFLFLLNVRTTVISLASIPISIMITVLVFKYIGLSINTMTLGGLAIAIGALVDDAVVDVENIFRRLRQNRERGNPRPVLEVVLAASIEVRSGILYATIIIILVFIPLFALSGIEGKLFAPLGVAYIVSILASLITATTVTPVLSYYLLPSLKRLEEQDGLVVRILKRANQKTLLWAFDRPITPIAVAGVAVTLAVIVAAGLPRSFLPPFNEGTLTISMLLEPGISLAESNRLGSIAERRLLRVPEIKTVGRRTGRAELDEHAEGVHSSEIDVDLVPSDRSREEILQDVRRALAPLPVVINVGQPISHRLDHLLSGVRAKIALKIYGDDLDTLRALARDLKGSLADLPGLRDLQLEKQVRIPQVQVRIDYDRAALYGITPGTVTEVLETLSNGRVVSHIVDRNRRFDVVLRLADADRTTDGLANLLVETPAGRVPLRNFAYVADADGPNQILREDGRRRIVIMANTDGSDMAKIIASIRAQIAHTPLPAGYSTSLEGAFQAQESAARLIAGLSVISLCLIFVVLYSRYRSAVLSLIIMANIPLALVGSVAALWLAGQPLSLASMIGFITLAGISTRNGILKISHYINLALQEGEAFGTKLILRGSQERLTPVLMTASAAGFALIPLMIGADAPGKEILHPVAVVIFGGLISATILDAILTPVLFKLFGERAVDRLRNQAAEMQTAEAF